MAQELKTYGMDDPEVGDEYEMYKVSEVDAVLSEKDAEIRKLTRALWLARAERAEANHAHWATIWFCDTAANLNINKSSVSQEPYESNTFRNASEWRNMWYDIASKCRAKAEKYK